MEQNIYDNTIENFALVDNNLAKASRVIGESSNLAQIALTYTYNFDDQKYYDYVCILSVLAQVAIDSAKRRFDIDLISEVKRIKKDMNVKENGLPSFWGVVKNDINRKRINKELKCPMNYLATVEINDTRSSETTLPMSEFFVKYQLEGNRTTSKKVEELIEKYSLDVYDFSTTSTTDSKDEYLLLRSDFDNLLEDIRRVYISKNYIGLMSWLIDRAFLISAGTKRNSGKISTITSKNKSLLMKVLYDINKKSFLQVFSAGL